MSDPRRPRRSAPPAGIPCDRLLGDDVRHLARHVENLEEYRELGQCAGVERILRRWPLLAEVEEATGGETADPATGEEGRCVS